MTTYTEIKTVPDLAEEQEGASVKHHRKASSSWFKEADLADLGTGYPDDEYDDLALAVRSMLSRGLRSEQVVARTREILARGWGVEVSGRKVELLRRLLNEIEHALD